MRLAHHRRGKSRTHIIGLTAASLDDPSGFKPAMDIFSPQGYYYSGLFDLMGEYVIFDQQVKLTQRPARWRICKTPPGKFTGCSTGVVKEPEEVFFSRLQLSF
jgi:hypothetical protein